MPFLIPSEERITHLINTFSEGGFEAAQITEKSSLFYYMTELEEIGPIYVMDDFGDALCVSFEMLHQHMYIHPPLAALT